MVIVPSVECQRWPYSRVMTSLTCDISIRRTPFIPGSFPAEKVETFGKDVPVRTRNEIFLEKLYHLANGLFSKLGRAGQPEEVSVCYVWLASNESSYMTGQVRGTGT